MRLKAMKRRPLIVPPSAGWIPKSYYHVECAVDWSNVVHPAIFYSGFLEPDGTPGSYAGILTHGEETCYSELSYLRAVRLLHTARIPYWRSRRTNAAGTCGGGSS